MGATNVKLVYATGWATAGLSHPAFRLLVFMSVIAHDQSTSEQQARVYFGGHDDLGDAMGKPIPREPGSDDSSSDAQETRTLRKTRLRQVRKYITELRKAGAVTDISVAHRGYRANYKLHPDYARRAVDNLSQNVDTREQPVHNDSGTGRKGGAHSTCQGGAHSTSMQVHTAPERRGAQHLPRNHKEPPGTLGGTMAGLPAQPQSENPPPVDNSDDSHVA